MRCAIQSIEKRFKQMSDQLLFLRSWDTSLCPARSCRRLKLTVQQRRPSREGLQGLRERRLSPREFRGEFHKFRELAAAAGPLFGGISSNFVPD